MQRLRELDMNAHITGTPMIGMNGGYLSGHERPDPRLNRQMYVRHFTQFQVVLIILIWVVK